ncbi:S-layer homology domain-containing protein [Thiolapillus sp.]
MNTRYTTFSGLLLFSASALASQPFPLNMAMTTTDLTPEPSGNYGIADASVSVVSGRSFTPLTSSQSFSNNGTPGNRCLTDGGFMYAPFPDDIPDGARITSIDYYFRDMNNTQDGVGVVGAFFANKATGAGFTGISLTPQVSTSSAPGDTVVNSNTPFTLDRTQDINSDGNPDVLSYSIAVQLGSGGDVCINQVAITWYRQVSPAPLAASFGDVPTSHAFFQEIEALAASGITSGCGGGNYCPDNPLTRGQMAVFLARALGLHWAD